MCSCAIHAPGHVVRLAAVVLKQHVLIRRVLGLRTEQSRFRPCPHIGTARDRSAEPACFSLPHSSALTDCSRARSYTNCFRLACDRTIRRRLAFAAAQLSPHGCGHEFSLVLCLTRLLPHCGAGLVFIATGLSPRGLQPCAHHAMWHACDRTAAPACPLIPRSSHPSRVAARCAQTYHLARLRPHHATLACH